MCAFAVVACLQGGGIACAANNGWRKLVHGDPLSVKSYI